VALDYYLTPLLLLQRATKVFEVDSSGHCLDLHAVCGDVFSLPFSDNTFDLVFNSGVIEHYEACATRIRLVRELCRVTRPNGYVCIMVPNRNHVLDPVWNALVRNLTDHDEYGIPEQCLTLDQLSGEMKVSGLAVITGEGIDVFDTICHYPTWLPLRVLAHVAHRTFPRPPQSVRRLFGTRLLVLGKKSPV